jgi:hypothetical protein
VTPQSPTLASHSRHRPGVDRRCFLLTSVVGALTAPRSAVAQQTGKAFQIGVILHGDYIALRREDSGRDSVPSGWTRASCGPLNSGKQRVTLTPSNRWLGT